MKLRLPTDRYHPGQRVTGTLDLEETGGDCEALLLRLWWAARGPDPDTDEVSVIQERTLATGALSPGVTINFSLPLPVEPISFEGALVAVRWALTARIRWRDGSPDTTERIPLTLAPGPLPSRARIEAEWRKRWRKQHGTSWLDRLTGIFQKQPLQVDSTVTHPGDTVALRCADEVVAHHWRLLRVEASARREIIEHSRTGRRTEYRWAHQSTEIAAGRIPLRGEPGARRADVPIPQDAVASLLRPTRRIRWEIRVSTTAQEVVAPLVVLPGS